MDQPQAGTDTPEPDQEARGSLAARRRLLKRSLGAAAPVALTLATTPVSAGVCMNASSFVSVATFASRQPAILGSASSCTGRSPSQWLDATDWPAGIDKSTATFGAVLENNPFNGSPLLTTVLMQESSLEAAVAAVFLSASHGLLPSPFGDGAAVREIWANVRQNNGYAPSGGVPALTLNGTRQWLAMTWQAPQP